MEIKAAMNGTWKSHFWYGASPINFVIMPVRLSVTAATRKAILAKENAIIKGTFDRSPDRSPSRTDCGREDWRDPDGDAEVLVELVSSRA